MQKQQTDIVSNFIKDNFCELDTPTQNKTTDVTLTRLCFMILKGNSHKLNMIEFNKTGTNAISQNQFIETIIYVIERTTNIFSENIQRIIQDNNYYNTFNIIFLEQYNNSLNDVISFT